jgi:hypothetical protein
LAHDKLNHLAGGITSRGQKRNDNFYVQPNQMKKIASGWCLLIVSLCK